MLGSIINAGYQGYPLDFAHTSCNGFNFPLCEEKALKAADDVDAIGSVSSSLSLNLDPSSFLSPLVLVVVVADP